MLLKRRGTLTSFLVAWLQGCTTDGRVEPPLSREYLIWRLDETPVKEERSEVMIMNIYILDLGTELFGKRFETAKRRERFGYRVDDVIPFRYCSTAQSCRD
jgi:hypothetical protein